MQPFPQIETPPYAPPLVMVFASIMRAIAEKPDGRALISAATGVVALQSSRGPQAVTLKITADSVLLEPGVDAKAAVVITMDFDQPQKRPKIRGLLRHPLLVYRVSKLLAYPSPDWQQAAPAFWALTQTLPDMPAAIQITCTDMHTSMLLGDAKPDVELFGKADALSSIMTGQAILVAEVMSGKINYRGSMQHLAGVSQACQKMMLGELHG